MTYLKQTEKKKAPKTKNLKTIQTKSLTPICLLSEITLKLKIFFPHPSMREGGNKKKEYATMPKHHGVVQRLKSITTNKNKEQELDLLFKKRKKKKKKEMSWYLAIW